MICSSCQREIPEDIKYCTYCGMLIVRPAPAGDPPADTAPAPGAPDGEPESAFAPAAPPDVPDAGKSRAEPPVTPAPAYEPPVYTRHPDPPDDFGRPYAAPAEPAAYEPEPPRHAVPPPPGPVSASEPPRPASITFKSSSLEPRLSAGQFFLMELLSIIPVIGFIAMCVWAFGKNTNVNRSAYAQAKLIMRLIVLFVLLAAFIAFLVMVANGVIRLDWLSRL